MADKIKKFFEKKKVEAKFKMAGPGHRLTESKPVQKKESGRPGPPPSRSAPSAEAKQAAAAALARLGGNKHESPAFNTSLAAIQAQVRRELEAEKLAGASHKNTEKEPKEKKTHDVPEYIPAALAVQGVYYKCSIIGPEILSKNEWKVKIKEFLYEQLNEEQGLTSCLIIHSCNRGRERVEQCVETICKYLDNIIQNPGEDKYRKIRLSNRIYAEKVKNIEGAFEFLTAVGFHTEILPFQDTEEQFLVFAEENIDVDNITLLMDALRSAEPIAIELDRNLQVLLPSQAARRTDLPLDFFTLSPEELKKEQQTRAEKLEDSLQLKTKAMREREEQRELKKYRYSLIRIRFPDGILLQGTFGVYEHLSTVYEFVRENLACEENSFMLHTPTGHRLVDSELDQSLLELHFVPATILLFNWLDTPTSNDTFLKPEVMLLMQPL